MKALLSSPKRLQDNDTLQLFKQLFAMHGVLGVSNQLGSKVVKDFSELDRLGLIPLVFGLMPIRALNRSSSTEQIKPYIREHLRNLSIASNDETIVDILKAISDQFYEAKNRPNTKFTLAKVKASYPKIYKRIREEQSGRCAVCGVSFDDNSDDIQDREELDHCLPWCLAGDPLDGSNWQLLCKRCNSAKKEYISTLQHSEALNWVYNKRLEDLVGDPNRETRYITLVQRCFCEEPGCSAGPKEVHLFVIQKIKTGLPIADNLGVFCKSHKRLYTVQGY